MRISDWSSDVCSSDLDVVAYPEDGAIDGLATPESFESVRDAMKAAGVAPDEAEVTYRADNDIAVDGDTAQQVVKLLDRKRVVEGKSVSVRVVLGGRRIIKKQKT